jgi:hypothetical protein
MAREKLAFKKRDLARAIAAAESQGMIVTEIKVDKAGAHIVVARGGSKTPVGTGNSWDSI